MNIINNIINNGNILFISLNQCIQYISLDHVEYDNLRFFLFSTAKNRYIEFLQKRKNLIHEIDCFGELFNNI